MRIDALVSQVLAQLSPLTAQQPRRSALQMLLGGGGDNSQTSARSSLPVASRTGSPSAAGTDSASFSTGAQLGSDAVSEADDGSGGLMESVATMTDQFVRQRAIVSYSLPGKGPFGANIDVVLDVETAYRRVDLLAPVGKTLDTQA